MTQRPSNKKRSEQMEVDVDENAVNECVRYILCVESNKAPIKRADIIKHLQQTGKVGQNTTNVPMIIEEANKVLKLIYGYLLMKVARPGGVHYILIQEENSEPVPSTAANPNHRKLLTASLMHIYMSGGSVKDDDLWKFLDEAGLLDEHDLNGRKIITNIFTRQLYLTYAKVTEGDASENIFEWGQRAVEEIPKMFMLKKMSEIFEKPPEHWSEQYKEAVDEENQGDGSAELE